ncbi:MAG: glycosyltransferase, partial [Nitrospinota bacterium]
GVVVHLVEDELKWLVLAFAIHDFSKNIQEQTLVVHTRGEFRLWNFSFRQNDTIWIHPVLGEAALVPLKPELFPEVRENRRSVCIVSLFNYGGYKNLSDRCASVFEDKGWQVSYAEPSKEEVERKIEEQYVTLLFSLSFSLTLSFLAMNRKIPYLCWELDKNVNPDVVNPAYISPHTYIYTTYKADVEKYIGAGANARFLPAAPNILLPESYKLSPREKEKYECDISFVGSPLITINNEYRKLKGELLEIFKGANKKEQGEIIAFNRKLDTILEKQNRYSLKNVFRLHQIFEEEMVLLPSGISIHLDHLKSILAKECCRYQRHQYLRRLDPLVVTIYGNSDWNNVNERNFRYRGEADFDYESGKIYLASKINIDITRVYTLDGFSDRVFNVLSRGGFLLINRTEALSQFFEDGKELVFFDSPGDLKEKCCYYLNAEDERKEIAERGKNRVRRFHNVESRVTEMLSELDAHEGVFTAKNADLYPSIGDIVPGKKQPEVVGKLS